MLKPNEVTLLAKEVEDEKPPTIDVIQAVDDVLGKPWEPDEANRFVWVTAKPKNTPRRVAEAYRKVGWIVYVSKQELGHATIMLTFHRPTPAVVQPTTH